jgi:DNA polymerase III subunit epsilon
MTTTLLDPRVPATRLLYEFRPRTRYHLGDTTTRVALYVDIDATGAAAIRFHYSPDTATIYALDTPLQAFDHATVAATLRDVSVVISHNARLSRPRFERRLPIFAKYPWACSMHDIPWKAYGFPSANLECLLIKHCREYYDSHHAESDCYAGIHLLATPLASGDRPLALLLNAAATPTVRVWAMGLPITLKDILRVRGYAWGDRHRPKAWYRDLTPAAVDDECTWLRQHVYTGRPGHIAFDHFDARDRYSART